MQILGLDPALLTLIICVVGVGLRVYVGKVKNPDIKFSVNAAILSFLIGLLISVGLVAPVIDAIPDDADSMIILPLLAGQIIVVMKSESLSTAAKQLISKQPKGGTPG